MNLARGQKRKRNILARWLLDCMAMNRENKKVTLEGFDALKCRTSCWIYLDAQCGKDDAIYKPTPKTPIKRKIKSPVVYKSLISHLQE